MPEDQLLVDNKLWVSVSDCWVRKPALECLQPYYGMLREREIACMKSILEKYLNKEVGINIENAFKFEPAQVIAVEDNYFSVVDENQSYTHHYSYHCIVQIIENESGVDVGGFLSHKHFNVVIKVGHIMEFVPGY